MAQYDVDLRDYWRILKKRKTVVILITVLIGIASYGFAKLKEPLPLYKTHSAIKISESTNLAAFFTGSAWAQGEGLDTHAYLIISATVLELTAKEAGLIPRDLSSENIRRSGNYMNLIGQIKSAIQPKQEQGTNVINIWTTSDNPQEAAMLANASARAYRFYNIQEKNKKTFETKAFIESQLANMTESLREAEEQLLRFEESYKVANIDDQVWVRSDGRLVDTLASQLNQTSTEYELLSKELSDLEKLIGFIVEAEGSVSIDLKASKFSEFIDRKFYVLTDNLRELLSQRRLLLVDFTKNHPQVLESTEQIRSAIVSTKKALQSYRTGLVNRDVELSNKIKALSQDQYKTPAKNLTLNRLRRDLETREELLIELKSKYQDVLIQESGRVEEVTIVRPALVPTQPFNIPSKARIVFTGLTMGLILGLVLAFGIEVFDTSIGAIEDVEELLSIPVIGVIPYLDRESDSRGRSKAVISSNDRKQDLVTHYDPRSLASEAFRYLRTNLKFISVDKKNKSFLLTSSFIQEGKTFNVVNLALSLAQTGNQVLLVETDLRKPVIHKTFGLNKAPGLTDYVLGNYHWTEIKNSITDVMLGEFEMEEILKTPGLDNLTIITAGTSPPNPSEILRSERFSQFLKEVYPLFDIILLDAPPVLPVADASDIGPLVDGVVLIYTVGKIGRGILKRAKLALDNVRCNVIGIVLNNVKPDIGPDYFKYHSKYYYGPAPAPGKKDGLVTKRPSSRDKKGYKSKSRLNLLVIVVILSLLTIGIYWTDLTQWVMSAIYGHKQF